MTAILLCVPAMGAAAGCGHSGSGATPSGPQADDRVYVCPMHCKQPGHTEPYSQHGPGQCPVCGMTLVVKPQ